MSDSPANHHTPYKSEIVSGSSSETPRTSDSAPHSTIPGSSSTAAPPTSTSSTRPETETSAPPHPSSRTATEGGEVASSDNHPAEGGAKHAHAEGARDAKAEGVEGASAATEYPPQMHAGKAGLGPHYNDGSGLADKVKAKSEIIKGKMTHNEQLVEQGHLRESGALAEKARQSEVADDKDSPFSRPDDGEVGKKPENPKADDVKETGHEARTAAATSGTKST